MRPCWPDAAASGFPPYVGAALDALTDIPIKNNDSISAAKNFFIVFLLGVKTLDRKARRYLTLFGRWVKKTTILRPKE